MVVTFSFCPWRCFLFLSFVFGRSGRTRMRGPDFLIIGNHGLRISLSLYVSSVFGECLLGMRGTTAFIAVQRRFLFCVYCCPRVATAATPFFF